MIQQIDENTYYQQVRGQTMTLIRSGDEWAMYTVNAVVRAYNRGVAMPKYFPTLEAVEAKYKTWRGIAALAQAV